MRELGIGNVPRGPRQEARSASGKLTGREQGVLALMSEGLRNREISQRLVISSGPCTITFPPSSPKLV